MNKKMYCPKCDKELIKGKDQRFETSSEHVCNPNQEVYPLRPTWVCNNPECDCFEKETFWNESGECYGGYRIKFPNDIHSAYPSFSRRMDTEIYKKDVKSKTYLPPFLMLWFLQPMIEYTYKADDYGKVLANGWNLIWLKKDSFNPFKKDKFGYHTHYSFPIMMIIRHIKNHFRVIRTCSDQYKEHYFNVEAFKPLSSWDKRWWRHFELWLSKVIFRKYYLKSLKYVKPKRY
jgi:hypothetical protein